MCTSSIENQLSKPELLHYLLTSSVAASETAEAILAGRDNFLSTAEWIGASPFFPGA